MIISLATIQRFAPELAPTPPSRRNPMTDRELARCPECGTRVVKASACLSCPGCGWGKCG